MFGGFRILTCITARCLLAALSVSVLLSGCGGHVEVGVHVKELSEEVTSEELERFLAIVDRLPGKKLPAFESPLTPPIRWEKGQEKSIERIATERIEQLESRWTSDFLTPFFVRNPKLRWAMASAEVTPEEFAGLALSFGTALSRSSLPTDADLSGLTKLTIEGVKKLKKDGRSLAMLPPDEQYRICQQSLWIPLQDVITHFAMVPESNLRLAQANRERLAKAFPPEFSENLLQHYEKILNNSGLPFEDLTETGITDLTAWNPTETSHTTEGSKQEQRQYEPSNESFTPPERLFGAEPKDSSSAGKGEGAESAELPAETESASKPREVSFE